MPGERRFTPYLRSTRRLCCGALFPLVLGPVRPTFAGCFGHALSIVSGFVLQWTYSWPEPLHAVLVVEPRSCFKCTMGLRCGRSHLRNLKTMLYCVIPARVGPGWHTFARCSGRWYCPSCQYFVLQWTESWPEPLTQYSWSSLGRALNARWTCVAAGATCAILKTMMYCVTPARVGAWLAHLCRVFGRWNCPSCPYSVSLLL